MHGQGHDGKISLAMSRWPPFMEEVKKKVADANRHVCRRHHPPGKGQGGFSNSTAERTAKHGLRWVAQDSFPLPGTPQA